MAVAREAAEVAIRIIHLQIPDQNITNYNPGFRTGGRQEYIDLEVED
jgi:hypothetical protein